MPERILGLDIGAGAVKAVLIARGFRVGYQVLGIRRVDVGQTGGLPAALRELFSDPAFRGAVCVTTLPSRSLSFRDLPLPFREDRKIRQTIGFALEPLLQTPIEDLLLDYTLTGRLGQAGVGVFAAAVPRSLVGERTALLEAYVRETAVIDIAAVPLALRLMEKADLPGTALLIDIGLQDTTLVCIGSGRVLHIRHFPFGGRNVTRAMAEALNTEMSEAEALKRAGRIPIAPEASAAVRVCCDRFIQEVRNTQDLLLWQGILSQPAGRIFLTGGGSRTPGLPEGLTERLAVPVERVDLAALEGVRIDGPFRDQWDPAVMDQALALAARPMAKGGGFNFRQRASARAGYGDLRQGLKKVAIVGGAVLLLAGVELGLGDYNARLRLGALNRDIQAEFRKIDPEATRIIDPVAQLRGKIAATRKSTAGMEDAPPAVTALDLLRELSALAPPDLLVSGLSLDGNAVAIRGEARSFDTVEAIKRAYAQSRYIKTVTVGSTNQKKQGEGVEFDLRIILKR